MRYLFGATRADWVMQPGTAVLDGDTLLGYTPTMLPNQPVTLWDARTGGAQLTDILDEASEPITALVADEHGNIPPFQGPDGRAWMWASASADGSATRYGMLPTDLGAGLDALGVRVSALEAGGGAPGVAETWRFSLSSATPEEVTAGGTPYRATNTTGGGLTLLSLHASAGVAPTAGALVFDVLLDGATIFATPADRLTIAVGAHTSGIVTAGFDGEIPAGSYLTVVPTSGDATARALTVEARVV